VVYVVCEGEVTEYQYLYMLNNQFGDRGVWLVFPGTSERQNGLSPRRVVDHALRVADGRDDLEAVWALFDRDEHKQIPEVFNDAKDHQRVRIAFSHPSFELWLLLHFQPYEPSCNGSSKGVVERLGHHKTFEEYGKRGKHITMDRAAVLAGNIRTAVKHARALVDRCPAGRCSARTGHVASCPPLARDPSSDVYLLIESLGIVPRS
jgi:hypothetical protein